MGQDFNPFKVIEDIGKGVAETAEGAVKIVQDGAAAVVNGIGGAVDEAAKAISGAVDSAIPKKSSEPRYRDNTMVDFKKRGKEVILVHEIYLDSDGKECEGPEEEIRLSRSGVELYSVNGRKRHFLRKLNIGNVDLYKNGKTEGGDRVRNSLFYGALAEQSGAGVLPAMAIGLVCTPGPRDIWFMHIREHDGTDLVYRLYGKYDGETLVSFLDEFALA